MTKTFKVEKKGIQTWVVIRQMAHDPQYKIGSRIPGYGKVVGVNAEESELTNVQRGDLAWHTFCDKMGAI